MVKYVKYRLSKDVYLLRLDDLYIKFFEGIWYIPEGITYNSYLITTDEGSILIDGWKREYSELFIEVLQEVVDINDIKKIVVQHTEPDHTGTLLTLLNNMKDVEMVGTNFAKSILESYVGRNLNNFKVLKDLEEIKLGSTTLKFIHTPWLHWPDTAMTYSVNEKILFTCDAFGGYSIPKSPIDESEQIVSEYIPYARKYFSNIVVKYRQNVLKNIDKILSLNLEIRVIAPGHGLVWVNSPETIIKSYRSWSLGESVDDKFKITIIYSSMYGSGEKIIRSIVSMLQYRHNIALKVYEFTDKYHSNIADILGDVIDSKLIIIGTATYEGSINPIIDNIITTICTKFKGLNKKFIIVSSYGWTSVADRELADRLKNCNMDIIKVITFKGTPTREVINREISEIESTITKLLE